MIHAYAIEPQVAATWGRREEFRYIHDKFGVGTPRVLLELPAFSKWKKAVYGAALDLGLSETDMKRVEELFRIFGDHRSRRPDAVYDGLITWLENAEREHARRACAGIIAASNPRSNPAVMGTAQLDGTEPRWHRESGGVIARTPDAMAAALLALLSNASQVHMVDPHFGPENARYRKVIEALLVAMATSGRPASVRVHCSEKSALAFFESEAAKMAARLPHGATVEFVRWSQRAGSEKLHNRYVLTDIGGVALGTGLDEGQAGETDDVLLLPPAQYARRWAQYAGEDGTFDRVDRPSPVTGSDLRAPPRPSTTRR